MQRSLSRSYAVLGSAALSLLAAGTARAELAYGITGSGAGVSLVNFDTGAPGAVTTVGNLTGIVAGHAVRGIDFRPATGELFAFSINNTANAQLYTVNLATGALTTVGSGFSLAGISVSTRVSLDFNPVVDRLRIVSGGNQSYRANPNDGTLVAQDTTLAYGPSDQGFNTTPFIAGVAYTDNVAGATSTTLYGFDFNVDNLVRVGSVGGSPDNPNGGKLFTVGPNSGFISSTAGIGFDISSTTGTAFLQADEPNAGAFDNLYTVDLATGNRTLLGNFGATDVLDIAVAIPEPSALAALGLGGLTLLRRRGR